MAALVDEQTGSNGASPRPASGADSMPRAGRWLVAGATLTALLLGLYDLGRDSFWVDDGFTLTHARLDNASFWQVILDHEMNGAAYSTLMHGWVQLGQSETWMRLPSVVFVTLAVPVLYLLGRRLFDERVAVTAAWLLAVNAFVVEYAHEARTYGLTLLVTLLSVSALVRYLEAPSRRRWLGWVLLTALLPYAHFFGALVVVAQLVAVLVRGTLPTPRRALAAGFATVVALSLPIALFLANGGDKGQVDAAPALSPVRFVGMFARLVGNGGPLLLLLAGIAIGVALVHGVMALRSEGSGRTTGTWSWILLVAWIAVPVAIMTAVSLFKPLFGAKYFLLLAPALVLLMASGIWQITRVRLAQALLGAIVVVSLVSTAFFYPRAPHDDFRSVAAHVLDAAEPGDGIVFLPWFTRVTFSVYADEHPDERDRLDPIDPAPDWGDWLLIDQPPTVTSERAESLLGGHDRVWVVERAGTEEAPQSGDAAIFGDALDAKGYEPVDEQHYPGLDLTLYERS